ncbi:hypothetical protein K378_02723 [Streptomyces sp. Amel2xB2]|uniref:DUF5324 family protein n=1 Tax=Streptomyces sp. Amel2xB2 TaxID=1305829 RepID=UPI000DB940FD|nr:DUF5324 family protein [Streptomyces sp. Amel2xB2]RAJ66552.1 hypothetical protein K378_02723 [Streptomyces sp. Amel2xB2]
MTRMDTVRAATGSTKESVRHAAETMAPYAESARDAAVQYAHEAGARLGPKVSHAARQARTSARDGYDQLVVPGIAKARKKLPPEFDKAATKAAKRTRKAARKATDYAAPRIESAVEDARIASGPVREEAASRGAAAFAALRGQVTAKEIEKILRKRDKRARRGRLAKRLGVLGLLAGGAYAAWRWWDKQANPDWLVEPPEATEVGERASLSSVGGSAAAERRAGDGQLDPEVEAKSKEAEEADAKAKAKRRAD